MAAQCDVDARRVPRGHPLRTAEKSSSRELVRRARPARGSSTSPAVVGAWSRCAVRHWRASTGTVVEIGFGSGPNVGLYPDAVDRVLAVEPSEGARVLARKRMAGRAHPPIDFVGLDGAALPVDDGTGRRGPLHVHAVHHPRRRRRDA